MKNLVALSLVLLCASCATKDRHQRQTIVISAKVGKFKFEVWHEGKKLCEQSFTVVPDTKPKDKR